MLNIQTILVQQVLLRLALVLAGFNATLTRCNGCYEKDLALHFNLIANTTSVIYYKASTDPYSTLANWNAQIAINFDFSYWRS